MKMFLIKNIIIDKNRSKTYEFNVTLKREKRMIPYNGKDEQRN